MSIRASLAVILVCGFTALSFAQAPPQLPKPGPEHEKLNYFVGKWKVESEIKANGYVPAGKAVNTETCTSGPGGFYVECLAEGQLPTRLAILGYDSHAKAYVSYYASSVGLVGTGAGSVSGDTWTWMVEDKFAGQDVKGRTTVITKSASQQTFKYEMLDSNGRYVTILEGTATKIAP